jgi:hypothetical protein
LRIASLSEMNSLITTFPANQYAHVDPYEVFRSANSLCAQPGPATDSCERRRRLAGMLALMTTLSSLLVCKFRSRAALELQIVALRYQLGVLRRQQSGRPTLTSLDRLLWVWLYRVRAALSESHGADQISDRGPVA